MVDLARYVMECSLACANSPDTLEKRQEYFALCIFKLMTYSATQNLILLPDASIELNPALQIAKELLEHAMKSSDTIKSVSTILHYLHCVNIEGKPAIATMLTHAERTFFDQGNTSFKVVQPDHVHHALGCVSDKSVRTKTVYYICIVLRQFIKDQSIMNLLARIAGTDEPSEDVY